MLFLKQRDVRRQQLRNNLKEQVYEQVDEFSKTASIRLRSEMLFLPKHYSYFQFPPLRLRLKEEFLSWVASPSTELLNSFGFISIAGPRKDRTEREPSVVVCSALALSI